MSIPASSFTFRFDDHPALADSQAALFKHELRKLKTSPGAELRGKLSEDKKSIVLYIAPGNLLKAFAGAERREETRRAQDVLKQMFKGQDVLTTRGGIEVRAVLRMLAMRDVQKGWVQAGKSPSTGSSPAVAGPAPAATASQDGLFGNGDEVFDFSRNSPDVRAPRDSDDGKRLESLFEELDDSPLPASRSSSATRATDTDTENGSDTELSDMMASGGPRSSGAVVLPDAGPTEDAGPLRTARERKGSPDGLVEARAGATTHSGVLEARLFKGTTAKKAGGKTGSKCREVQMEDGTKVKFQVKTHANVIRAACKSGRHAENFAEVIASKVARAVNLALALLTTKDEVQPTLVADVSLVIDREKWDTQVASRYVSADHTPTLDQYAQSHGSLENKASGHVRFLVQAPASRDALAALPLNVMPLSGPAADDLCRNIALSALVDDRDVNPGNMTVVGSKDPATARLARIDFGHAFGDLTAASERLGGGRPVGNPVLDFFNRERVAAASPGGSRSKLWRDYIGLVPTRALAEALKNVANSKAISAGLDAAKAQFLELAAALEDSSLEPSDARENEKAEVLRSLAGICGKCGPECDFSSMRVTRAVDDTFAHLALFLTRQQEAMSHVARLCELQAMIDDSIQVPPPNKADQDKRDAEIKALFAEICQDSKARSGEITWMKVIADRPALVGDLDSYRAYRTETLRLPAISEPARTLGSENSPPSAPVLGVAQSGPDLTMLA